MKKLNHIIHKFKCPIKKSQKKRIELKSDTYKKIKLRNKQIIRNSGNLFFIQPKTHQSVSKLQYYGQNKSYFELQPITETMEKKKFMQYTQLKQQIEMLEKHIEKELIYKQKIYHST